jgi:hemolysin activation/secretion protein
MSMPKQTATPKFAFQFAAISLLAATCSAWAGPDAGAQIRRYQDETQQRLTPRPTTDTTSTPQPITRSQAAASTSDARIHVSGFNVHGVTRFSQDEIAALLKPYIGKELDTAGIHAAADALNAHYRKAGYFIAKVFIPPQDVANIIRLDVYEGYLDTQGIEVINNGKRVDAAVIQGILEANINTESPIQSASYERALLIAEDLPGVTTSSTLYPGEHIGTARLRTTLNDLPLLSGNIDIDNFGSHATGQTRLGTTLYLNSPTQAGDQAVARLVTSGHGSNYAYLTYLRPVSSYGTRVGASVDYFGYNADYINNVGYSDGYASDARLYLTHPIIRSRHGNLNLRTDLSQLNIEDRNDLNINAKRRINSFTFALHGDDDHAWLGTGISLFNASVTTGNVDVEGNAAYRTVDQTTAQTDGGFSRFNFNLSRLQQLSDHWSLFGKINGQIASGNLDTSQKFYLGGATSVSGYPLGEAGGDQGWEMMAELRRDFVVPWGGTLQGGLFYQQGWLKNHKHTWNNWQGTNSIIENDITLKTVGLSAVQTLTDAWVLRGMVGWQLGSNPMRNPTTGTASDGDKDKYRAWFQVIRYF